MNRAQEIDIINAHIESKGVYRARMGESKYGDMAVPYRQQMKNQAKAKKRLPTRFCAIESCKKPLHGGQKRFCSPGCAAQGKTREKIAVRCAACGKDLIRGRWEIQRYERFYCNRKCQGGPIARQTHCKRGHEFTPENTRETKIGGRVCRICDNENARLRKARWRAQQKSGPDMGLAI